MSLLKKLRDAGADAGTGPYAEWYERAYPRLVGSGLWLRGEELNILPPSEYAKRPFRFLIARLSTYRDTAESITHVLLYQVARHNPGIFPDMAYLPPGPDLPEFSRGDVPWLLGTGTKRGPRDFDLIGFSNSIVQELVNLPSMLQHSGIPLLKSQRMKDESIPLIIMGGANALHSSVFWNDDPMLDGVFVGESETKVAELLELCRSAKARGAAKSEVLAALENVEGFFQPGTARCTFRYARRNQKEKQVADPGFVELYAERSAGEGKLQISEGCPCFCSFCSESFTRKPYVESDAGSLRKRALEMKAAMGLQAMELCSFNFNMHSQIRQVLWDMSAIFREVGLKSQRMDFIARDPSILQYLRVIGKASLTCGIEGISGKIRRYLHKNLSDADLFAALRTIAAASPRELKLFFIATGLEGEGDYAEFRNLLSHIRRLMRNGKSGPRIIVSVTPLVRFPWTPLEFADAPLPAVLGRIVAAMSDAVREYSFEFRQAASMDEYWFSQILVRASDRRIADQLLAAVQETDFIYYRDVSKRFADTFRRKLESAGVNPDSLLRGHSPEAENKPWLSVETGVSRKFLKSQYALATAFDEKDYCLGVEGHPGQCLSCGACTDEPSKKLLTVRPRQEGGYSVDQFKEHVETARRDKVVLKIMVTLGDCALGLDRSFAAAAFAAAIMKAEPALAASYHGFDGCLVNEPWMCGDDVLFLAWKTDGAGIAKRSLGQKKFLADVNKSLAGWGKLLGVSDSEPSSCSIECESPFAFEPKAFLGTNGLKHTLRKIEDGRYEFQFLPDSVKKSVLLKLELRNNATGCEVVLSPGRKFKIEEFLRQAFVMPDPRDWVRIRARNCMTFTGKS